MNLPRLYLTRIEQNDYATYGHLATDEGRAFTVTLEPPAPHCIETGDYIARRYHSPHFGCDVFRLDDKNGREAIELHIGNTVGDTHGCPLLGSSFGTVNGQHGVINSKVAFDRFMEAMRGVDAFTLTVVDATTEAPDL